MPPDSPQAAQLKIEPVRMREIAVDEVTAPAFRNPYISRFGTSQRLIVDLGDFSRSLVVNSTGQSGLLFHRHREDQIPLWRDHRYRPMLFSREAVEKDAEERLTLQRR